MVGPPADGIVVVLVARVPAAGVDAFVAYERAVLAHLAAHGGALERRLRRAPETGGDATEVHLVRFPSAEAFAAYRADPARAERAALLEASGARIEVLELADAPLEELVRPGPGTKP